MDPAPESFREIARPSATWVTLVCGAYAVLGAALALIGWFAEVPLLTSWDGDGIAMTANSAVNALLAGLALLLLAAAPEASRKRVRFLAGAVAAIGFLTLLQHAIGADFGIDTLLVDEPAMTPPNRMSPISSLSYALLSAALFLSTFDRNGRARFWASALALTIVGVALLNVIGHLFDARQLFGEAGFTRMAFPTATMLAAAAIGLLATIPEHGLSRAVASRDAGGVVFRKLLLPVTLIPIAVGWLRLAGEDGGLYDTRFGVAIYASTTIGFFVGLLWWTAKSISRTEAMRRKGLQELEARDRLLATVTDHARVGLLILSPEHRYLYANRACADVLGLPSLQIVGLHVADVVPEAYEQRIRPRLERAFEGERVQYDLELPPSGGSLSSEARHLSVHYEPQLERGKVKAVVVAITDITAIQQAQKAVRASEQRFRRIFDTVAVSLWEEDFSEVKSAIDRLERTGVRDLPRYFAEHPEFVAKAQGLIRVLDVNDATVKMFEARDKNELRGALPEIFTPESMPVLVEELLAVAEGRTYFEAEALLHTVRGNPLYVFFTMVLPSPEQSFDRVLFSVVDLSERKKAEEQVRKALEEAERAARLKDEFLATLSHELRTPMTAIHGWAQILCTRTSGAEGASNPELARALEVIERNARLQTQMIDDLLDMSRIIAGKIRLEIQTVELDLVAQAAVDAIRPAAEAKGIRLHAICEPAELRADSSRLQQVIYNLLSNAVKFTPKDGKVQVLCRRLDSHVEITVSDTGIGIEPRFLPHVFDRFRQQDATTTRSHRGLGLGLGIVKQLVELHGGRVQAASEGEGKGATFTVHLPVAIALPPPPRPDPATGREHKHLPPAETVRLESNAVDLDLSGISLLVVDDEPDARDLLRRMLQLHNARVEIAGSVEEAMVVLERHPPDVLLSDIGMPGEDGYALVRRLRKLPHDWARRLPAIALTAFVRSEDRTQALRAGFDMHLSKPIDAAELLAAVLAVTRHRVPG